MGIVIEGQGVVVQSESADATHGNVIDAGPPPAALLRRFGRPPAPAAMQMEGGAAPSARGSRKTVPGTPLNPLRAGEAIARARLGGKPDVAGKLQPADVRAPRGSSRKNSQRKRKK